MRFLLLCSLFVFVSAQNVFAQNDVCLPALRNFAEDTHKEVYRVGVLAIRGKEAADAEFNKTFSDYLTATAGRRFDRPIQFETKAQDFLELFDDVSASLATDGAEGVDFIYVNPSAYSCIESEYGANTLVSQISRRNVDGVVYQLEKFGGVIVTHVDRDDINTVADLKGKSIAAASISGLGSGQMQFRLMQQRGLAYIQDPKQLIFTSDQGLVVLGVLKKDFDVGFVRTDQIERTTDPETGDLVDRTQLKIIEGRFPDLDGQPFPFESSTELYPEWNVGSLPNVADDIAEEVQRALQDLNRHAAAGEELLACIEANNCLGATSPVECEADCFASISPDLCETTPELARLAVESRNSGKYSAWRSTLSYMELRNMLEETKFIRFEEDGINRCIRSASIYDAIVCPPGHFRKSQADVLAGCNGEEYFNCTEAGYQCLCSPCLEAFDVAVFEAKSPNKTGCGKFDVCGYVEQTKSVKFLAVDNKERNNPKMDVKVLEGETERFLEVTASANANFTYEFTFDATGSQRGTVIIQVRADGVQIPESPFRISVTERDCEAEFNDELLEADDSGDCVCQAGSVKIGGKCVRNSVLIPAIVIPLLVLFGVCIYLYIEHKRKQADSVWEVNPDELHFDDPPAILGRGTFGLVLLAEYRGTQVAVKRVIPPKLHSKKKSSATSSTWRNSLLGEGDMSVDEMDTKIEFDLNEKELEKATNDFDAMESGALGPRRQLDEKSTVSNRRSSIGGAKGEAAQRRNSYFDFENLNVPNQQKSKRRGSHVNSGSLSTDTFDGMESGAITKIFQTSGKPARRPSIEAVFQTQKPARRMSEGSIGSVSSAAIEAEILANTQLMSSGVHVGKKEHGSDPCDSLNRRHSMGDGGGARARMFPKAMRRHSIGDGNVSIRERSFPNASRSEPGAAVTSEQAFLPPRRRSISKKESSASYGYVSWGDPELIQEKEEGVFGSVSGSHNLALKSGRTSTSGSSRPFRALRNVFFGQKDEYTRLKAEFVREMRHLSKLRHPCITTVMGAVISKKSEPMLVMEYMDHGSLYDMLHNSSMVVTGELVLPILRDIAQGVRFLHAATPKVIHGDLKAQNVLVDSKFRAKVADFGLSQKKKVGATGTPLWMAPELLRGESENTTASDVYSFGIILYEVYSRRDPYEGENHLNVLRQVCDPKINKRPPIPEGCPPKIASIMTDCLLADPDARPTFEELDIRLKRLDIENVEPAIVSFSMQRKKKEQRAARNEELLYEAFPKHVAEALQEGKKVEAESFDCVTVFFSDIVGYTTISATLHPRKVSDMLDRLYLKFDTLCSTHEVFKIETIGDAYFCVTNLAKEQLDHAARIARFATDALKAARETLIDVDDPSKGYVKIRVGFHSGPIVADVVGSRSPKYTLFGDTVNTASRMESNSLPLRIQCSDRSAELIKTQDSSIKLEPRGKIHIKGKGDMQTYWVSEDAGPSDSATTDEMEAPSSIKFLPGEKTTIKDEEKMYPTWVNKDTGQSSIALTGEVDALSTIKLTPRKETLNRGIGEMNETLVNKVDGQSHSALTTEMWALSSNKCAPKGQVPIEGNGVTYKTEVSEGARMSNSIWTEEMEA